MLLRTHQYSVSYWAFRDDMAVKDGIILKGRWIIIPIELEKQAMNELHSNHMGTEKMRLFTHKSTYWMGILLIIHQYKERIYYNPEPDLFTADWLSRQNHKENKDDEIFGTKISINCIYTITDIQNCMTLQEIQETTGKDVHQQQLI